MFNATIKKRLLFISLLATAAALATSGAVMMAEEAATFRNSLVDRIEAQASIIGQNSSAAILFGDDGAARNNLAFLKKFSNITNAVIYANDGTPFADYARDRGAGRLGESRPARPMRRMGSPGRPSMALTGLGMGGRGIGEGYLFDYNRLVLTAPIIFDGERIGSILIESDLEELYRRMLKYAVSLAVSIGFAFFVAFVLLSNLQKTIIRPVEELSNLVKKVSTDKDYTARAAIAGDDELASLSRGFNVMFEEIQKRDEELERKVRLRTAELERSLEMLELYKNELERAYEKLKDSEKTLINSAKLVSLGEMGAGVAHELNSPLAGILSITEALIGRSNKDPSTRRLLEKIKDAAVRSKYIIQDILTYARPAKSDMAAVCVNEAVKSTLSLFVSEFKRSSIEIREELEEGIPAVIGNKGQLMEVFLNIIKNARDSIQAPGVITIRTRFFRNNGKGRVVAEIEDTGAGIPDEIKDRIFDPFFTTKEKGGGLNIGLGLSITKSIVELHNGAVAVESHIGKGTVFRIILPAV